MRIPEKCRNRKHINNNSDNPLTSRRSDGGKKNPVEIGNLPRVIEQEESLTNQHAAAGVKTGS